MLGKVEICGVNTADLKVLSSDACRALLIRAKHGDRDAREQLIAGNLRLVLSRNSPGAARVRTTCFRSAVSG